MSEERFFGDAASCKRAMGRMSRLAGGKFLDRLALPGGLRWLDVGCGTGSFAELVLERNPPSAIGAVDRSEERIAFAKSEASASRIDYRLGYAMSLAFADDAFDVVVLALVIHHIADPARALSEISRLGRPRGTVAACVWPGRSEGHALQHPSDAVRSIGGAEAKRPGNQSRTIEALVVLFVASGLERVESCPIELTLRFDDFDDYWSAQPVENFRALGPEEVVRLKDALGERVPTDKHGRISYGARMNAIRGRVPR